jgi:D-alanine-D-alanine ligase
MLMMCIMLMMQHDDTHWRNGARDTETLILLCGGASAEHDVSLASARSVLAAVNGARRVRAIVIGRDGKMLAQRESRALLGLDPPAAEQRPEELLPAHANGLSELTVRDGDVVFPLLHGPFGEDGSVQGLLKLMGVPHVGSGVLASAVGMDKLMMKAVFAAHGLPQVRYRGLSLRAYRQDPDAALGTLRELGLPVFVKPANLGSSVGIHLVEDEGALRPALEDAFGFDRRVIVEAAVVGWRELEVAVLGNDAPELSPVGEVRYRAAYYDYASKYEPGGADLLIPAPIPAEVAERASTLARRAFEAIDGAGLARVDLFYDEGSARVLVNEINTMPGFTATSMFPRLWAAAGLEFGALVERLVALARERASLARESA